MNKEKFPNRETEPEIQWTPEKFIEELPTKEGIPTYAINEYLEIKLEDGKTEIYVGGKKFMHCKFLILNIPKEDIDLGKE